MMLGATISDLKSEADALASDLDKLTALRASIASQRDDLARSAQSLALDKTRLTELIRARQQSLSVAESALGAERKRAAELAGQAANLKDLIAGMEREIGAAKAGADAAAAADRAAAADVASRAAAARGADPARLTPAIAFADAKGRLSMPVAGAVLKTFGSARFLRRRRKGRLDRDARRRDGVLADRRLGCLLRSVSDLWTTLDTQRRWGLLYGVGGHGSNQRVGRPVRSGGRACRRNGRRVGAGRRRRRLLAPRSLFFISKSEKTKRRSIPGRGGRSQTSKRRADDSQSFLSGVGRGDRRRDGDFLTPSSADPSAQRLCGGRRHLPPAQSFRRRVRENSHRLRREARRSQADRGRHQRHAVLAGPAFELHGRESLSRHAGADQGRVRRPRDRGHRGGRRHQGRDADRRHARRPRPASCRATSSSASTTIRCRD